MLPRKSLGKRLIISENFVENLSVKMSARFFLPKEVFKSLHCNLVKIYIQFNLKAKKSFESRLAGLPWCKKTMKFFFVM